MPPVEANGKQVELVDAIRPADFDAVPTWRTQARGADWARSTIRRSALPWWATPRTGSKYPYNPFYGEFSPRVAVAWNPHFDSDSPMGKIFGHEDTVIRGGYGRIYGRLNGVDLVLVPLLGTGLIQPVQCVGSTFSNGTLRRVGTATATPVDCFPHRTWMA